MKTRILSLAVTAVLLAVLVPSAPVPVSEAMAPRPYGLAACAFPREEFFDYAIDRVKPDNRTQAQMNQDVVDQFVKIIPEFKVDPNPATRANPDGFLMVLQLYNATGSNIEHSITTSESMGYGMLMLAYMAGSENIVSGGLTVSEHLRNNLPSDLRNAYAAAGRAVTVRDYFDGMLRCLKQFPSYSIHRVTGEPINWSTIPLGTDNDTYRRTFLMSWTVWSNPRPPIDGTLTGAFSYPPNHSGTVATDGDLDMAYSLLVAEAQWQSPAYGDWARGMINDLFLTCVDRGNRGTPARYHLYIGNWPNVAADTVKTRPSDFMLQHLRAFEATEAGNPAFLIDGVNRWTRVINATVAGMNQIYALNNPRNGILPDFVIVDRASGNWTRPTGQVHETGNDGNHFSNSCRVPWRLGTDMLLHGDKPAVKTLHDNGLKHIHDVFVARGAYNRIGPLTFQGTPLNDWGWVDYAAPAMVAASVYGPVARMNMGWEYCRTQEKTDGRGFGAYFNVLCMIAASGNWWDPTLHMKQPPMRGDVDGNGVINSGDVTMLRRYIAHISSGGTLAQFEALVPGFVVENADINGDGAINAADVTLLRRYLADSSPPPRF
jgi:endo-1,4-beta-D-glucanase Y